MVTPSKKVEIISSSSAGSGAIGGSIGPPSLVLVTVLFSPSIVMVQFGYAFLPVTPLCPETVVINSMPSKALAAANAKDLLLKIL
ncbi:MAG: hypothetical protein BWX66_01751 [Deltaproteobacteria bacterium ADurb.Bin058]|nr:MAG: hypothetical protein BWX66_01751 [Deltaproteobacteria bacterium ADurb.Bin058]